ncbi:GtrA family protein [Cohnella sp. REN36]|uniref:GtrA family protein n=1 Tax=Cohnella sp. REN36 TaxID=2887347 RepID=UPI001D15D305|nr:GtrA family protein [Cohnella sp. REN36]MCC3374621.1 GtrA family protein [Cohnella sp. REN36]
MLQEWRRLFKFALVGGMNTGIDVALFAALVYGLGLSSTPSQFISYFVAFLNSYWWNKRWTFQTGGKRDARELIRFGIVNLLSFLFATGVLLAFERGIGFSPIIAKLLSVFASLAVNYTGSKLWVFRKESVRQQS